MNKEIETKSARLFENMRAAASVLGSEVIGDEDDGFRIPVRVAEHGVYRAEEVEPAWFSTPVLTIFPSRRVVRLEADMAPIEIHNAERMSVGRNGVTIEARPNGQRVRLFISVKGTFALTIQPLRRSKSA